jgi:hypothetical protein
VKLAAFRGSDLGRKCRDAFTSLKKTCRMPAVIFDGYCAVNYFKQAAILLSENKIRPVIEAPSSPTMSSPAIEVFVQALINKVQYGIEERHKHAE